MRHYIVTLVTSHGRFTFEQDAQSPGAAIRAAFGDQQLLGQFAIVCKVAA